MKLVVLGSGTCGSQMPGIPNRFPPAFLVEWDDQVVMFDCSEAVRYRLEQAGYKYAAIQHVAISHPHQDHYAFAHYLQAVACFSNWIGPRNEEIHLYAPATTIDDFPSLWAMHVPDDPKREQKFWPAVIFHKMSGAESQACKIGSGTLTSMSVYHGHGRVDAVAFRLETPEGVFVYSGDTGDCESIRKIAKDADVFLCECSGRVGDEEIPKTYGHLNPRVAGLIARDAGAKKLIFFHYTGLDPDSAIIEDCKRSGYDGPIVCAKDFQQIEFP